MMSETCAPARCAPSSLPLSASTTSLKTPASSPMAWALPSSRKLLWGQVTLKPFSLAWASVRPTVATSGEVKTAAGTVE
ncbi:hypothetical protein DSECCO2_469990 [anaerobic digester metagenome]